MATIYVTGHRNPDTDSIASAIGYAELRRRLDPNNDYVPVRLGDKVTELDLNITLTPYRDGQTKPKVTVQFPV